ncbi:hypothetical protein MKEN_01340100 [Mycena kentingensis (nom. inval.)]|nr:hypothetical protein MKEN_01340100 [Mycena kentingensis (nom. inval.)]
MLTIRIVSFSSARLDMILDARMATQAAETHLNDDAHLPGLTASATSQSQSAEGSWAKAWSHNGLHVYQGLKVGNTQLSGTTTLAVGIAIGVAGTIVLSAIGMLVRAIIRRRRYNKKPADGKDDDKGFSPTAGAWDQLDYNYVITLPAPPPSAYQHFLSSRTRSGERDRSVRLSDLSSVSRSTRPTLQATITLTTSPSRASSRSQRASPARTASLRIPWKVFPSSRSENRSASAVQLQVRALPVPPLPPLYDPGPSPEYIRAPPRGRSLSHSLQRNSA